MNDNEYSESDKKMAERRWKIADTGCQALIAIHEIITKDCDNELKLELIKTVLELSSNEMLAHITA